MLKESQGNRIVVERLENAVTANGGTIRGSLNLVWNLALIGTVIGLLVGVILAFVVK